MTGLRVSAASRWRAGVAEMSDQENKAIQFKNERVAQMLYANDGGTATFQLGLPQVAARVANDVATQKVMAAGMNPQIPFTSNKFAA